MAEEQDNSASKLVDHLFRHEAGKMVAVLTRIFGFNNVQQAEDIVQDTIVQALETWKYKKIPDNPQAWLYRVAKNKAIDLIRRDKVKHDVNHDLKVLLKSEYSLTPVINQMFTENEIADSQLRMMFACCHPSISQEAQITLILKTLCGLNVHEIANAFLTNEETIQKRLYRTKEKIATEKIPIDYPGADAMPSRTEAVLRALYLLFNEGYNSSHPERLIREDLSEEAMRLTILLTENPKTTSSHTYALLALMCYQASRFDTRLDDKGYIVLLKDQDRKHWNRALIEKGNEFMQHASAGDFVHSFHIEAAIASIHANSPSYEETNWKLILGLYDSLLATTNSPVVELNRCLVIGEVEGYENAVSALLTLKGMENNCHYNASLGEMYLKSGKKTDAKTFFEKALKLTPSKPEQELLKRKLGLCN